MIILDNGHGGLINGIYQTSGKRGYHKSLECLIDNVLGYESKGWFYEGVYNRLIVSKLVSLCELNNIDYVNLVPENEDIKLHKRVSREKLAYKKGSTLLSIHCDAFSKESANGFSTFSYGNVSKSSQNLNNTYSKDIDIRNRGTRTANFYMLRKTKSKAVLLEMGFMTNEKDCKYLLKNVDLIVDSIFEFIKEL